MIVNAIQCPTCLNVLFSRAQHDYRPCSCGEVAVDGGFEYLKCSFKQERPVKVQLMLAKYFTKKRLYDDYNQYFDKYGIIDTKLKLVDFSLYYVRGGKIQI